jgi:hypothetical protein
MARNTEALIGMAVLALTALAAFAVYRWRMRQRVRQVRLGVEGWLSDRYGELPKDLSIDCSDDSLWPVLVGFDDPGTGTRHRLRFAYNGQPPSVALVADSEARSEIGSLGRGTPVHAGPVLSSERGMRC